jgi:HD-GYP domain-containing protein (c-di-GMP phosphodiesterase class II)
MTLIRQHPATGYEILKDIAFTWPIAEAVYQHHERLDGSGYPRGLKGEEIIPEARILAVADTIEAISSHRPYRPGLGIDRAIEQIKLDGGNLFDQSVVDAAYQLFSEAKIQKILNL